MKNSIKLSNKNERPTWKPLSLKEAIFSLKQVHIYHVLHHTLIITLIRMTGGASIINKVSD